MDLGNGINTSQDHKSCSARKYQQAYWLITPRLCVVLIVLSSFIFITATNESCWFSWQYSEVHIALSFKHIAVQPSFV